MTSERPWASQPSARSPRRPWQNGALAPSLQVAIIGSLSGPAGGAANGNGSANAIASLSARTRPGPRARTVTRALNHRAVTDTSGHPLGFMHIVWRFRGGWTRTSWGRPVAGDQLAVVRTSRPLTTTTRTVAALFALCAAGAQCQTHPQCHEYSAGQAITGIDRGRSAQKARDWSRRQNQACEPNEPEQSM